MRTPLDLVNFQKAALLHGDTVRHYENLMQVLANELAAVTQERDQALATVAEYEANVLELSTKKIANGAARSATSPDS